MNRHQFHPSEMSKACENDAQCNEGFLVLPTPFFDPVFLSGDGLLGTNWCWINTLDIFFVSLVTDFPDALRLQCMQSSSFAYHWHNHWQADPCLPGSPFTILFSSLTANLPLRLSGFPEQITSFCAVR
ncbi:MAG: hypothetical protein Q8P67_18805 [archaeon]|nr:hypothetical protein [archaeon]